MTMGQQSGWSARAPEASGVRERLLVAAVSAFSKIGFDGTSLRHVEREAGVNRGLAAYHFGSKHALWQEAVSLLMDRFHDEMKKYQDVLRVVSTEERGRVLIRVLVHFAARYPEFFRLLLLEGAEFSERSEWLAKEHVRRHIDFFHKLAGTEDIQNSEREAIAYYSLMGAASTVFGVPAQCKYLFGLDPSDEDFVDVMAERVSDIYVSVINSGTVQN